MDIERLIKKYSSEEDPDLSEALAAVTAKVTWAVEDKPFTPEEKIEAVEAMAMETVTFVLGLLTDVMGTVGDWSDEEVRVNRGGMGAVLDFIRYATYANLVDRRILEEEVEGEGD